jgi:hypothetical protein
VSDFDRQLVDLIPRLTDECTVMSLGTRGVARYAADDPLAIAEARARHRRAS